MESAKFAGLRQPPPDSGTSMYELVERLYPLCRSITGDGVRQTLQIVSQSIPLEIHEVPTGTPVYDWTIPREWNIRDAYIADSTGRRLVDFGRSSLHVVSYSVPVRARLSLQDLRPRLHVHPQHADWVPYRTSYYNESWGFCLSQNQLAEFRDEEYEVVIDASLEPGSLTYGEFVVPGAGPKEVLFFTHICHPALCNDNLSGIAVLSHLAKCLVGTAPRYTYRFVFAPGTIGSIAWLARNEGRLDRIEHGLVVALVGDRGGFTYKRTRSGEARIDKVVEHVLRHGRESWEVQAFSPYGYDERQFGSPGLRLPVGRLTRTPNGAYPEYHSSADDLALVTAEKLDASLATCLAIVSVLEGDQCLVNTSPNGEPQLGRRGLYRKVGGHHASDNREMALLWVLNQADGSRTLLDIADRAGLSFWDVAAAASDLWECGLLKTHDGERLRAAARGGA